MAVGGLYVEIAANIARLVSGVEDSRKHLKSLRDTTVQTQQTMQRGFDGITKSWIGLSSKLMVVGTALRGLDRAFEVTFGKGLRAVEEYNQGVITAAAVTLQVMDTSKFKDIGEAWKRAEEYAAGMVPTLEEVAIETAMTGQQVQMLFTQFAKNGVLLDATKDKAIAGFKAMANAVAIMTKGQGVERQIMSEINALMSGQARQGAVIYDMLEKQIPNMKEQVNLWKEQGTLMENLLPYLKGFDAASGKIKNTWEATKTTLETTVNRILRESMSDAYKGIIGQLQEMNKWIDENKTELQETARFLSSGILTVITKIAQGFYEFAKFGKAIGEGLYFIVESTTEIRNRIGLVIDSLMQWANVLKGIGKMFIGIFSLDTEQIKSGFDFAVSSMRKSSQDIRGAFKSGFLDNIGKDFEKAWSTISSVTKEKKLAEQIVPPDTVNKVTEDVKEQLKALASLIDKVDSYGDSIKKLDPTMNEWIKKSLALTDATNKLRKSIIESTDIKESEKKKLLETIDSYYKLGQEYLNLQEQTELEIELLKEMAEAEEKAAKEAEKLAEAIKKIDTMKMESYLQSMQDMVNQKYETGMFAEGIQEGTQNYLDTLKWGFDRGERMAEEAFRSMESFFEDLFVGRIKLTWQNLLGWMGGLFAKFMSQLATQLVAQTGLIQSLMGSAGAMAPGIAGMSPMSAMMGLGGMGLAAAGGYGMGSMLAPNSQYGGMGGMVGGLLGGTLLTGLGTTGMGLIGAPLTAGLFGASGGALGASLGTIVPVIGTIIGGLIGTLAGSLFSEDKPLPMKFGIGYGGTATDLMHGKPNQYGQWWTTQGGDEDSKIMTEAVRKEMTKTFDKLRNALKDFMEQTGGDISKFDEQWKSDISKFKNKEDFIKKMNQMIGDYASFLTGIDFEQYQKAGEEFGETIARIVDSIMAIPDIKSNIDDYIDAIQGSSDEIAKWREAINKANDDLKDLKKTLDESTDPGDQVKYANDLKVAIYEKYKAEMDLVNGLIDAIDAASIELVDFEITMQQKIADLTGTFGGLIDVPSQAMETAKRRMEEAGTAAEKLGYLKQYITYLDTWVSQNVQAIESKYNAEKKAIQDQVDLLQKQVQLIQLWRGVADSVRKQLTGMQLSLTNPAGVMDRLSGARGELERLRGLYLGATGETKAGYASQLQDAVNAYIGIAQEAFQRPSPEYIQIYDEMVKLLDGIQKDAEAFGVDDSDALSTIAGLQAQLVQLDIDMAADIKAFKDSAVGYYEWAQKEGIGLYGEYIDELQTKLDGILGGQTIEEYTAAIKTEAANALEALKIILQDLWDSFSGGAVTPLPDETPAETPATGGGGAAGNPYPPGSWMWKVWDKNHTPSYASGTPYVPRTGYALLHQGERVTPAGQNGLVTIGDIIINASGDASAHDIAKQVEEVLVRSIKHGRARKEIKGIMNYG
uniref:Putative tail tape measure protein n=1 Tax=viral metagenome TaxID=1070528 RepID=A0A6M3J8E8_9ZZZZ